MLNPLGLLHKNLSAKELLARIKILIRDYPYLTILIKIFWIQFLRKAREENQYGMAARAALRKEEERLQEEEEYNFYYDEEQRKKFQEEMQAQNNNKNENDLLMMITAAVERDVAAKTSPDMSPEPVNLNLNAKEAQNSPGFAPDNVKQMEELKPVIDFIDKTKKVEAIKKEIVATGVDKKVVDLYQLVVNELKENMDKIQNKTFLKPVKKEDDGTHPKPAGDQPKEPGISEALINARAKLKPIPGKSQPELVDPLIAKTNAADPSASVFVMGRTLENLEKAYVDKLKYKMEVPENEQDKATLKDAKEKRDTLKSAPTKSIGDIIKDHYDPKKGGIDIEEKIKEIKKKPFPKPTPNSNPFGK